MVLSSADTALCWKHEVRHPAKIFRNLRAATLRLSSCVERTKTNQSKRIKTTVKGTLNAIHELPSSRIRNILRLHEI